MTLDLSPHPYTREKIRAVIIHKVYNHLPRLTPTHATPPPMLPLARFFEKNLREMMVKFQQAGSKTSRKRLVSKGTMVLRQLESERQRTGPVT